MKQQIIEQEIHQEFLDMKEKRQFAGTRMKQQILVMFIIAFIIIFTSIEIAYSAENTRTSGFEKAVPGKLVKKSPAKPETFNPAKGFKAKGGGPKPVGGGFTTAPFSAKCPNGMIKMNVKSSNVAGKQVIHSYECKTPIVKCPNHPYYKGKSLTTQFYQVGSDNNIGKGAIFKCYYNNIEG